MPPHGHGGHGGGHGHHGHHGHGGHGGRGGWPVAYAYPYPAPYYEDPEVILLALDNPNLNLNLGTKLHQNLGTQMRGSGYGELANAPHEYNIAPLLYTLALGEARRQAAAAAAGQATGYDLALGEAPQQLLNIAPLYYELALGEARRQQAAAAAAGVGVGYDLALGYPHYPFSNRPGH
jgi:hypothetical protein